MQVQVFKSFLPIEKLGLGLLFLSGNGRVNYLSGLFSHWGLRRVLELSEKAVFKLVLVEGTTVDSKWLGHHPCVAEVPTAAEDQSSVPSYSRIFVAREAALLSSNIAAGPTPRISRSDFYSQRHWRELSI